MSGDEEVSIAELLKEDRLEQYATPQLMALLVKGAVAVVHGRQVLRGLPLRAAGDPEVRAVMNTLGEIEDELIPAIRRVLKQRGE